MRGWQRASKASLPGVHAGIVNGIYQTPTRGKGGRLFLGRGRCRQLLALAAFAMNHALSVRVADALRIGCKPGFPSPRYPRQAPLRQL